MPPLLGGSGEAMSKGVSQPPLSDDSSNRPASEGAQQGESRVEGTVERIVYENEETGFFVGRLRPREGGEPVAFLGNLMAVTPGETIRLWGHWEQDKKWGKQLRVHRYESILPSTVKGIEKYLGSGLIEGIGPVYAKRLVDAFGVETFRVIDEEPERLENVPGVGPKRASQIREAWAKQKAVQSIMVFLQGHGISANQAVRIYRRYGDAALTVLRDNPYRLAGDISGISFKRADKIARELGVEPASPKRIEAGLLHVLDEAGGEGHVFLPDTVLQERAAALLEVDQAALETPLANLVARGRVIREDHAVYLARYFEAENRCAQRIAQLAKDTSSLVPIQTEKAIAWVEKQHAIQLAEQQRAAIRKAAEARVMVITGGPGTGKTTVLNSVLSIFEKKKQQILLGAPTGRAAKRMEDATGRPARTLHRLLEFSPAQGEFVRNADNPLDTDLVVVDEASMIDTRLMASLLSALAPGTRLFLVGDVDQLPSVGAGHVLFDIIASNTVPVIWLDTVFRQAAESGIVSNAHRINQGAYPEFNTTDFFFVERLDPAKARDTVVELVARRMPQKFELDPAKDIQVLTPMHRGEAGVARLNEVMQEALNPQGEAVPRKSFRVGDKVMQTRNNYELDVYNGDVGTVALVSEEAKEVQVDFEDRSVLYPFEDLDDLMLAYAATVHKAQGSEYAAVVLPLLPQHYMLLQRNLVYTAITRAKRIVIIVGAPKALRRALHNNRVAQRHTRLAGRLRNVLPTLSTEAGH